MYYMYKHILTWSSYKRKNHTVEKFKGTRILFQFLFLIEKSILYAKITVPLKKFLSNFSFKYYIGLLFS